MQPYNPKYSIIIPVRNGGKYLPACVETIINQEFDNYELIISDDHSTDSTSIYLDSLVHPNVKKVKPPQGMSMAEHWGWAIDQSVGNWIIVVGQDDGLQPYFFKLAEILTKEAECLNLKTIMSQRAYFFWPGCDAVYGNTAISYHATNELTILNSKFQALRALLGLQTYFELPEMYTTSLFNRKIIEEAKSKQGGKLFLAHPQDANLAAIACCLESRYLKTMIPLGWVGSSPKSAGLAVMSTASSQNNPNAESELIEVRADYLSKTANSMIKYNPLAGNFSLGSCSLYFWGALLETKMLRSKGKFSYIQLPVFKLLMFSSVLFEIESSKKLDMKLRMKYFYELLEINHSNLKIVKIMMNSILPIVKKLDNYFIRFQRRLFRITRNHRFKKIKTISYNADWTEKTSISMKMASQEINTLTKENKMFEFIKRY